MRVGAFAHSAEASCVQYHGDGGRRTGPRYLTRERARSERAAGVSGAGERCGRANGQSGRRYRWAVGRAVGRSDGRQEREGTVAHYGWTGRRDEPVVVQTGEQANV